MSHLCVNRIIRLTLALVCAVVLMLSANGQSWAAERIHLSLDTVGVSPGQTTYMRVWLTNPLDSIAGFQIWLQVDRPNIVTLGLNIDTSGTALSGWEYVETSSLGGQGYDLLLTGLRNDVSPPAQPAYPPHVNRNLLVKIPVTMPFNPDTLFEKFANVSVSLGLAERFSFADQNGNNLVATVAIISDTDCYRCDQWMGETCLSWTQVAVPPCDSLRITVDTIGMLDTTLFSVDNSQAVLRNCTSIILAGDIDLDGLPFSVGDYTELIRYVAGDTNELPLAVNADINGDCRISWADVLIFTNYFTYGQPYLDTLVLAECTCPNPVRACCEGTRGNLTSQMDQRVDISDLSLMVSYMTGSGVVLRCIEESNINGAGSIDLSDLSILINYLTQGGALPACP
ncbi:MAG: hypothetical protein IPH75_10405 [bacterium]|nr:hypothetical protein [bacterium]